MNSHAPTAQSGPSDRAIAQAFNEYLDIHTGNKGADTVMTEIWERAKEIHATEVVTGIADVALLRALCEDVPDMHHSVRTQLQGLASKIESGAKIGVTRCRKCGDKAEVTIHETATAPPAGARDAVQEVIDGLRKDASDRFSMPTSGCYGSMLKWADRLEALTGKANGGEPRLDKPATIRSTTFGVGVKWATVIERAQREHEYQKQEREARKATQPAATGAGERYDAAAELQQVLDDAGVKPWISNTAATGMGDAIAEDVLTRFRDLKRSYKLEPTHESDVDHMRVALQAALAAQPAPAGSMMGQLTVSELIAEIRRCENIRGAIGGTPEIGDMYREACASFLMLKGEALIAALSAQPAPVVVAGNFEDWFKEAHHAENGYVSSGDPDYFNQKLGHRYWARRGYIAGLEWRPAKEVAQPAPVVGGFELLRNFEVTRPNATKYETDLEGARMAASHVHWRVRADVHALLSARPGGEGSNGNR